MTARLVRIVVIIVVVALVGLIVWVLTVGSSEISIVRVATGLENPRGIAVLPDRRLVVVEAGNGIDSDDPASETGRVSVFGDLNQDGDYEDANEIVPMISQIPSYNTLTAFGTGHDEVGGTGDVVVLEDGRMFFTRDDPTEGYAADGTSPGVNVVEVNQDAYFATGCS